MDFNDTKRCDLIKMSIENDDSTQRVESGLIRRNMHMDWSDEENYLGGESILDIMACDNTNWQVTHEDENKIVVESEINEEPLIELAKHHPESNVRIAAIGHITDHVELSGFVKNDPDNEVKKASLDRLEELFIR